MCHNNVLDFTKNWQTIFKMTEQHHVSIDSTIYLHTSHPNHECIVMVDN